MKRRAHDSWTLAMGAAMGLLAATACAPIGPSPTTTTTGPQATSVALASAPPSPTPLPSPSILCDQPQVIENVSYETPTCAGAIEIALSALPPGHPRIVSLDFRYGFFCEPGRFCVLALPPLGHVVATYIGGDRVVVNVRGEDNGTVTMMGVVPYPTPEPVPEPST
jgi:hypothetical protein